jgi:Flp pilus assembly protein CpaB
VTIPIEHISAVQGFARPGSFVDVLFRSRAEEERPEVTITLLERVKVLAVNKNTLTEKNVELEGGGAVTLSVTPIQAKSLKVVEGRGELSLTLRNPNDELDFLPVDLNRGEKVQGIADGDNLGAKALHPVNKLHLAENRGELPWWMGLERVTQGTDQISLDDLLNIPPKPKPASMIVYRGGNKEVIKFHEESRPQTEPMPQMIQVPVERPFVRQKPSSPQNSKVRTVQFETNPAATGG